MQHKSENFIQVFRFSTLGCYNSTILTGISSRDSEIRKEVKGYEVLHDLVTSGGLFLEEVDQRHHEDLHRLHVEVTIKVHHRSEGNLTGEMDLGEVTTKEYLLVDLRMGLHASPELTVRRHMRVTKD